HGVAAGRAVQQDGGDRPGALYPDGLFGAGFLGHGRSPLPASPLPAHRLTSCAGLMLPPVQMRVTLRPANRPGSLSTAASGAAPAGSTRLRVFSIISRVASRIASSETRTKSSSCSRMIRCGRSNAVLVASPSANVAALSVTSDPVFQE